MEREKQLKKYITKIQKTSDKKAANELVAHYYHEIYCYMYKQTIDKELAMELTQEIFVSMLQTIGGYDEKKSSFRTWLYRVATNKVVDHYRSRAFQEARAVDMIEDDLADEADFSLNIERKLELERVIEHVNQLEVIQQKIFRLKIFGDYTFIEIADMMKLPESTVKTKYYAIQKRLRTQFQGGM